MGIMLWSTPTSKNSYLDIKNNLIYTPAMHGIYSPDDLSNSNIIGNIIVNVNKADYPLSYDISSIYLNQENSGTSTNNSIYDDIFVNSPNYNGLSINPNIISSQSVGQNYVTNAIDHGYLASSPTTFGAGDTYYNSIKNTPCYYSGINWMSYIDGSTCY